MMRSPRPSLPSIPAKPARSSCNRYTSKTGKSIKLPSKLQLARAALRNTKDNAKQELDKLQKAILALQIEKEFIQESYESGGARCWEIKKRITDMQEEVFFLQDGYSATVMIDDDEARALMAVTALKSCEATVNKLEKRQRKSKEEIEVEFRGKLLTLTSLAELFGTL